jgi:DNA invertase Pin-like site-specific DNA recombinase
VLAREWDGHMQHVMVLAEGFSWKGTTYASLSKVASAITGTRPVRHLHPFSTEARLDQEFNSLDARHDASEAYIRSQAHAGWALIRSRYDNGGFSGGSTERPALQRLLIDIQARKLDIIVVYKVDRLTRSLADFAKLVELFDAYGVSFVSVTQQFNTTTSMGRLTLNVLLSFAEFEQEVTSERIRDKIGASKRKGLWVGGKAALGYEVKNHKIVVVENDAERVRTIFRSYLKLGSINLLMADLHERKVRQDDRRNPVHERSARLPRFCRANRSPLSTASYSKRFRPSWPSSRITTSRPVPNPRRF